MSAENRNGTSRGVKILLAMLIGGAICVTICCGGFYYFLRSAVTLTTEPGEITEVQNSIVGIQIPEDYQPRQAVSTSVMGITMRLVNYSRVPKSEVGTIVLMQMESPGNRSQDDIEKSLQDQLQQTGHAKDLQIEKSEIRTLTIDGKEVDFVFSTGTMQDSDKPFHQVQGVFPGRSGTVMLVVQEDDTNWDEEAIIKLIESITIQPPRQNATAD